MAGCIQARQDHVIVDLAKRIFCGLDDCQLSW